MSGDEVKWVQAVAIILAFSILWFQNFRQFHQNGGKSMKDSLVRIEKRLGSQDVRINNIDERSARIERNLLRHVRDSDEIVDTLKDKDIL